MSRDSGWLGYGVEFLTELAIGVGTCRLYSIEHPRAQQAQRDLVSRFKGVLKVVPSGEEVGLEGEGIEIAVVQHEVFFQGRPVTRMGDEAAVFARHLRRQQVERVTFKEGVTEEEMAILLSFLAGTEGFEPPVLEHVSVGKVVSIGGGDDADSVVLELPPILDRLSTVQRTLDAVGSSRPPNLDKLEQVVASIDYNLHGVESPLDLLAPLDIHAEWPVIHSHNTAALSLGLAAPLSLSPPERCDLGIAAVFHDIGKYDIDEQDLRREMALTGDEWELDLDHPRNGLETLLAVPEVPELAAIVAFDHHLRSDGSGYPKLRTPRPPHPAAALVTVAEAFDNLYTIRLARGSATEADIAIALARGMESNLDPVFVRAMLLIWEGWKLPA